MLLEGFHGSSVIALSAKTDGVLDCSLGVGVWGG